MMQMLLLLLLLLQCARSMMSGSASITPLSFRNIKT